MLLFYTDNLLTIEMAPSAWRLTRVWYPSSAPPSLFFRRASGLLPEGTTLSSSPFFFPPCAATLSQVPLGRILHALGMTFAMLTHWVPLTVWFPTFWTSFLQWSGWASLLAEKRTSERNLSVGSLHAPVLCFTRFHQVLGWSSCLALSNQQACVRPYCFTGRPRPLGTSFSTGSMVLSI